VEDEDAYELECDSSGGKRQHNPNVTPPPRTPSDPRCLFARITFLAGSNVRVNLHFPIVTPSAIHRPCRHVPLHKTSGPSPNIVKGPLAWPDST